MNDVITYCEDTTALIQEVQELYPDKLAVDETTDDVTFLVTKTPTVRNGVKTLTLVRCTDEELALLNSLETLRVLGTYDEIFADTDKDALYKSVYPYDEPVAYTDENGETIEYHKPKKIGEFAG